MARTCGFFQMLQNHILGPNLKALLSDAQVVALILCRVVMPVTLSKIQALPKLFCKGVYADRLGHGAACSFVALVNRCYLGGQSALFLLLLGPLAMAVVTTEKEILLLIK